MTIPAVGERVALVIYAAVGDIKRFASARLLCAYAGLVPSVHQSGETLRVGAITKTGIVKFPRFDGHPEPPGSAVGEMVHGEEKAS